MNEATSFCILRKCNIIPKAMKSICIRSKYLLIVWSFQEVYVYEYKLTIVDGLPEFNGFEETSHFVNGLVAVINSEENLYVLDRKGAVFLLDFSEKCTKPVDDMDIFEASPDEECSRQQSVIGNLDKCDELLAATEIAGGFASCAKCKENIFLQLWHLDSLEKTTEHVITDTSPCEVFLCYNKVPISGDLKRKYFSFLQEGEQHLLLVGMSSGHVLSLSCSRENHNSITTILSTPYSISSVNWIVDELQHICVALLVQFLHGTAMLLDGNRSQMLYLAGPVYTALFDSSCNAYATSDGVDCIVTKLELQDENFKYECSVSPLKGIRSMCKLADRNLVLVGTQHRCIYWLNLCSPSVGNQTEFEMPEDRLLDSLLASTACLETICLKMEKEDAIIRAVALAKRAQSMSQYFTILAKVYSSSCHAADRIKVRVETSCDFVDFSCDVWRLELTVVSPQGSKSEIILRKLKKSFNCDNPMVCEMEGMPAVGSEILCSMLAPIEIDQPWLAFPIGKIQLDAGYFLSVVNQVPKLSAIPKLEQSILCPAETNQQIDTVITLTLSPHVLEDQLFATIFFNSSHRMLKEQWVNLKDKNTTSVNAIIGDNIVYIKLDKASSSLKISSSNTEMCHHVKQAILSRIISNLDVSLNEKIYVDAEAVRLSFEVAKLSMDFDQKTLKNLKDSIRNISKNLPT